MTPRLILTHPGSAHKDDFLAAGVLAHLFRCPVARREPTRDDLEDPAVIVIDVGSQHDPELANFDHHQFPRSGTPTCALSLVLQHLGAYEDALEFHDWLEPAEWMDCRGPHETARWLGVNREVLDKLRSPLDLSILRRFSLCSETSPGEPLWEVMAWVGGDVIEHVRTMRARLSFLEESAEFWTLADGVEAAFVPRAEQDTEEPAMALPRFIDSVGRSAPVVAMIYPDRRGKGFALARYHDDSRIDFTQVSGEEDVHFAHARGFIAKTTATEPDRLRELLSRALVVA